MADRIPLKYDGTNGRARQMESGDTVGVTKGGTGLAAVAAETFLFATGSNVLAAREFSAFTELAEAPAADDVVLLRDTSASAHKKIQISNLLASSGAQKMDFTNDNAGTLEPGTPVYLKSDGDIDKAQANSITTARVLGLTTESIATTADGEVQLGGYLTLTTGQWDTITGGSGGLTPGAVYYLDPATAGLLTTTPPSTVSHEVAVVGIGLSTTAMHIQPTRDPIGL